MADDKAAFEKIYGKKVGGPSIPFGTLVEYIPITSISPNRLLLVCHPDSRIACFGLLVRANPDPDTCFFGQTLVALRLRAPDSSARAVVVCLFLFLHFLR